MKMRKSKRVAVENWDNANVIDNLLDFAEVIDFTCYVFLQIEVVTRDTL